MKYASILDYPCLVLKGFACWGVSEQLASTAVRRFATIADMVSPAPVIPELSVVIPCLNEARTLTTCIRKAQDFFARTGTRGEVVVADNGSTDGSAALAEAAGARVIAVAERGYGAALAGGIAAARGVYVIMGDGDDSYDFSDMGPMLSALRDGADLVVGNRFQGGIMPGAMPFLNRWLGNPVLSALGRLFFGIPLRDFHCGLRGARRAALLTLDLRTTGMEYASEMIVRAALHGLRLAEVPVTLRPDGRGRKSHLNPWRDGWRHLRFLLLYSPRWLYLYPGVAMIALGMALAALVLPGPFMVSDTVGLDVHTLLVGAMSILMGVQSITFGFMARAYASRHKIVPDTSRYGHLIAGATLERVLVLALALVVIGLVAVLWAVHRWSAVNFGALDYRDVMRILILAVTCLVGGLQLGLAAFFMGIMEIGRR